jgi:hypothetical protein
VITDQNIYFFKIDQETFEPSLDNVMFNFMACDMMLFGTKANFGITYKNNQNSFEIYQRHYHHNYLVPTVDENLEGSKGLELKSINAFLVSKIDKIILYDSESF